MSATHKLQRDAIIIPYFRDDIHAKLGIVATHRVVGRFPSPRKIAMIAMIDALDTS
jgi:hypothetical protein